MTDTDALAYAKRELTRAERPHKRRCESYRRRYRAWAGVLERENDIWETTLAPMYGFQKLDVLLGHIYDASPGGAVVPVASKDVAAAKGMELLLADARRQQGFAESSYDFALQCLVMGVSPAGVGWSYEEDVQPYNTFLPRPGGGFEMVAEERPVIRHDHPSFTPL